MSLLDKDDLAVLKSLHAGRPYHNWVHIENMLALIDEHRKHLSSYNLVEAAVCFHDAVYDSTRNDNEELSAALAVRTLGSRISGPMSDFLRAMILATKNHIVPEDLPTMVRSDTAFLLDADLSILGGSREDFAAYDTAVRLEFSWADDTAWATGRKSVLEGFLARETIYLTPLMRKRFEAPARENIRVALTKLAA